MDNLLLVVLQLHIRMNFVHRKLFIYVVTLTTFYIYV